MPDLQLLAHRHYTSQSAIARALADALLALWAQVEATDIDGTWLPLLERAAQLLAAGQYAAAAAATAYVRDVAAAQDADPAFAGLTDARAFTGVTADGRALSSLLALAGIYAKAGIANGLDLQSALARGAGFLALAGANEVAQAGRNADHVALTSAQSMSGYVRMLTPPSCDRCVVLAGKWFHWNQGFARHPRCDCVHVPATRAGTGPLTSPRGYFDSLTAAQQDATFGLDGARAIRDGADIAKTVNLARDTATARRRAGLGEFDLAATEAAAQRGMSLLADLYKAAGGDRSHAVSLLTDAGYLTAA